MARAHRNRRASEVKWTLALACALALSAREDASARGGGDGARGGFKDGRIRRFVRSIGLARGASAAYWDVLTPWDPRD